MNVILIARYLSDDAKTTMFQGPLERIGAGDWGIRTENALELFMVSPENKSRFYDFVHGRAFYFSQTDEKFFWEMVKA